MTSDQTLHAGSSADKAPYRVLVAARSQEDLTLLHVGCALAQAHEGEVHLLTITPGDDTPTWLKIPEDCQTTPVHVSIRSGKAISTLILRAIQELHPDLLILGWDGRQSQGRYIMGRTLDPVIQSASCNILVVRGAPQDPLQRILIPISGGPNAPQAFALARALAPGAEITALYVVPDHLGKAGPLVGKERLEALVQELPQQETIRRQVTQAAHPAEGILAEAARGYDLVLLGATSEDIIGRFLFTAIPQTILLKAPLPVMIIRHRLPPLKSLGRQLWVRVFGLVPSLTVQEQAQVYKTVRRGSRSSTDFSVMITIAAAIAALGLLLNSPAVIIGAMLVAPLMTPILGMGLSIVMGDRRFLWTAFTTTLRGILLAITMGALMALIVPGASITQEILNRGNPTLLDLAVALVSGAAAAYALSRHDVSAALVGVAIAASLAPPLTAVGISLVLGQWTIAGGALLLFLANMVSIVASGGLTFFLLGFRPEPGEPGRTRTLQRGARSIAVLLLLVIVPLAYLTHQSYQAAQLRAAIDGALRQEVQKISGAELVAWELTQADTQGTLDAARRQLSGIDRFVEELSRATEEETLDIAATLRIPQVLSHQEARALQDQVALHLERPVALSLEMIPTTSLHASIPPTPTPTGVPTATPTTPPTPTLSPTPRPTRTPSPTPTHTPTVTPWVLTVEPPIGSVVSVRYSPGGMIIGRLTRGAAVEILEPPLTVKDERWYHILSIEDRLEGWIPAAALEP
ncbi:MAG: DUF389 domain-containing protein [Anaerolineae bacterium]|jgi:uncharacterized hydrophobic protein (TIGR00271 family)|nr:DUF389 domain-containing protein [Anaerolineae bacterium]